MIELKNLTKKFDHRGVAGVLGISLEIQDGEICAVLGPNGSGKTTLLNLISGKLLPEQGEINLSGEVHLFSPPETDQEISVQAYLISRVIFDTDEDKKIQLSRDLADIFEFTSQIKQKLKSLSSGQLQKVLVAGELINRPQLILLDEPFNHLDPLSRQEILKSLFNYLKHQEISAIWVTHDLNEAAQFAQKLVLLQHGKIEQSGSPAEVMLKPRNVFCAQFMGHENFLVVKSKDQQWQTPWGLQTFEFSAPADEAILVIPPLSWKLDPQSEFETKIEAIYLKDRHFHHQLVRESQSFFLADSQPVARAGERIKISPEWSSCFLISL